MLPILDEIPRREGRVLRVLDLRDSDFGGSGRLTGLLVGLDFGAGVLGRAIAGRGLDTGGRLVLLLTAGLRAGRVGSTREAGSNFPSKVWGSR